MKKLLLQGTLLLLFACNNQTTEEKEKFSKTADLSVENLKGDISSYDETPFKTDSTGKIGEMDSCCIVTTEYNTDGNAINSISKDSEGTVKEETTFERHPNGLWKSATTLKDGKTTLTFDTKIDANGNYVDATGFDSTGNLENYYTNLTQNEYGQVVTWKRNDKDSVFREEGELTYDKNLQTGFTGKDSLGNIKQKFTAKFNDKGEQTETSNTNITKDSTTTKIMKFTYDTHDDMGNWTQRTTWDEKGNATKITKRTYNYRKKE